MKRTYLFLLAIIYSFLFLAKRSYKSNQVSLNNNTRKRQAHLIKVSVAAEKHQLAVTRNCLAAT